MLVGHIGATGEFAGGIKAELEPLRMDTADFKPNILAKIQNVYSCYTMNFRRIIYEA